MKLLLRETPTPSFIHFAHSLIELFYFLYAFEIPLLDGVYDCLLF
jgi:hypothetical protein